MARDYEAEFDAALRSFEASGEFLIHVQCGPNTVALVLPGDKGPLRAAYAKVWKPYFEAHCTRLALKAGQPKARYVRDMQISAIWGACTRADVMSPEDRANVVVLANHLMEMSEVEHDLSAGRMSAWRLDIQWGPNGTYKACDRFVLRRDLRDHAWAPRDGRYRSRYSTRH